MDVDKEQNEQLLTREQLAERWQCTTRTIDRYRAKPNGDAGHLKTTELSSGAKRFRLKDVKEFERRNTKHFLFSATDFLDTDAEDLDPAAGTGEKPNFP